MTEWSDSIGGEYVNQSWFCGIRLTSVDEQDHMKVLQKIIEGCVHCNICVKDCAFLEKHGTPGSICQSFLNGDQRDGDVVFGCNLCGLCTVVCPKDLEVSDGFTRIRQILQKESGEPSPAVSIHKEHKTICAYERRGASSLFSLHQIPSGCEAVFFPGCTLAATKSATTLATYIYLQSKIPSLGIVLDCCSKSSHDLGLTDHFNSSFKKLRDSLKEKKIQTIYTACPGCYVTFANHAPEFTLCSVYEKLAEYPLPVHGEFKEIYSIHDSCVTRDVPEIHESVRLLIKMIGATIEEPAHRRGQAICCGEGAAAAFMAPDLTDSWKDIRRKEAEGCRILTYCAGCAARFGRKDPAAHLLDLIFNREKVLQGREQHTRAPFTYLNRLLLKRQLKRQRPQD